MLHQTFTKRDWLLLSFGKKKNIRFISQFHRDYHVILACDILGQSMILSRDISAIVPKYSVKFTRLFSKEILNQTKT